MATATREMWTAAVASLQARMGCGSSAGRTRWGPGPGVRAGGRIGPGRRAPVPSPEHHVADDDRVVPTGFAALDAILGPGGLPRSASVALRGDGSSGKTTLALRLAAEAQAHGLDRGLAGPRAQLRPGRGGRPRRPARVAGRPHAGQPRRGPRDRGLAPRRPLGRPAGARPARRPTRDRREPARSPTGSHRLAALARRAETLLVVLEPPGLAGGLGDRGRGVDRPAPGARPTGVDPARARRRRPADGGAGRPQPLRPARAAGDAPDPLRGRRRARRLPPPGRPPHSRPAPPPIQRPRHPNPERTDPRCDCSTSSGPHLPARARLERPAPPSPFPPGPIVLGGQPWTDGTVSTRTRTPGRSASGAGSRSGAPTGSRLRRPSSIRILTRTAAAVEAAFERLAAFSPGIAGERRSGRRRRSGCSRSRSTASSRLWGPEPVLVERLAGGARARPCREPAAGRDRRDALRGDRRGRPCARRRRAASSSRPATTRRSSPRIPAGLLTHDPDIRARLTRFGLRTDRGGGGAARLGARRPVRRGGRADPCPGPRRGDRAVPAAPDARSGWPWPARSSRRPRSSSRSGSSCAGSPARSPTQLAGPRRGGARGRTCAWTLDLAFARAGTPGGAGRRAALPGAHRGRRGDRAAALRPAGADAAAGRRRRGWTLELAGGGAGGRSAAPAVRAAGRPRAPGSAGSSPGSPSTFGEDRDPPGRRWPTPRRRCPRRAGAGESGAALGSSRGPRGARDDPAAARAPARSRSSWTRRARLSRSAGTAGASRSRSATAGGSRRPGGASPIARDYFKVVGRRWLALVYLDRVDGTWHLERLYD